MQIPQTEVILRHNGTELARVTLPPGEYVIGRSSEVAICADTPLLSRQHARLVLNFDSILIEDLGSSNGTFVGDQPVTAPTRLFPNQSVRLGDVALEVRRLRADITADFSLAPVQKAIRRHLPPEILADKRYSIGSIVARGGMGAILDARQNANKRTVAMKVMLDTNDEGDVLRFIEEAQITSQLEHPNIVPIYELGVDEQDQLFYTMKMVRGITLKKVLELLAKGVAETAKKFPLPALLTIFQKVCDAIAFAHSKGVIHRDLKPENLMLGDFGSVLVMDWGLAKLIGKKDASAADIGRSLVTSARDAEPDSSSTMTGTIMGTPQYMAPEQARGEVETMDQRADIYALGAILFHLLFLRAPIGGNDAMQVVGKVARGELEWPAAKELRSVPDSLLAVCRKALALDSVARYPRVETLQADILAYQNGFATSAEEAGWFKRAALAIKRNKAASIATALVLLSGMSFGTKAVLEGRRAEREAAAAKAALADLKATAPDLLALAASEAGLQRYESALKKADAALALDPSLAAACWRRGWVLLAQEKLSEALAALHLATEKDPANHRFAALLPLVEKMATAPAARRHDIEFIKPLYDHLTAVGAVGEATPLLPHLKLGNDARLKLVRERVERWLGKGVSNAAFDKGQLTLSLFGVHVGSLEPLRGLPIDVLTVDGCGLISLEPLSGMRLVRLTASRNAIEDLSPLAGMPLGFLSISDNPIKDLVPLHGLPLTGFSCSACRELTDLSPLSGMALEELSVQGCPISDFSVLRGMPLRRLDASRTRFADMRVLSGMPLADLSLGSNGGVTDLSPLVGLPLTALIVQDCPVRDFTPLLRIPRLERLAATPTLEKLLPLRVHPGLKQIKHGDAQYRPVADFWADYDARQKGAVK